MCVGNVDDFGVDEQCVCVMGVDEQAIDVCGVDDRELKCGC